MNFVRCYCQISVCVFGLAFILVPSLYAQRGEMLIHDRAARLQSALQATTQQVASLRQKSQLGRAEWANGNPSDKKAGESPPVPRDVLRRLDEIEARLEEIQKALRELQGWMEEQTESLRVMSNEIAEIKRFRAGNYVQFQYRDTNEPGGSPDAFAFRRVRLSQTNIIDARTSMRLSFDVAAGTDTLQAQVRNAQLVYDIEPSDVRVGAQLLLGQQPLPLGYELERSSAEREFPERTYANRILFNGERGRGVHLRYGTSVNSLVHVGVWNVLTINDPEQRGRAPGVDSRLAVSAGFRLYSPAYDFGVSLFAGKRPAFTADNQTSPEVHRRFLFLDGSYIGLLVPNLFVRAEAMFGTDRVPSTVAHPSRTAKEMLAWHVVLGYNLSARNQLALRYEQFDADRDSTGDAMHGYGVAYIYYINPGARVTAAYEVFQDPSRTPQRYHATTLRLQFRM